MTCFPFPGASVQNDLGLNLRIDCSVRKSIGAVFTLNRKVVNLVVKESGQTDLSVKKHYFVVEQLHFLKIALHQMIFMRWQPLQLE